MTKELLEDYILCGREIEFKYKGKMYSITYSPADQDDYISFYEFYKSPTNVKTLDELLEISCNGDTVCQMWNSLTEDSVWVF